MKVKIMRPVFRTDPDTITYETLKGIELELFSLYNGWALCSAPDESIWNIPADQLETCKEGE